MTLLDLSAARRGPLAFAVKSLLFLLAYGLLLTLFSKMSEDRGLLTPSGSLDPGFLTIGILGLAMRIAVLFVLPLVAVYGTVRRLIEHILERRSRQK